MNNTKLNIKIYVIQYFFSNIYDIDIKNLKTNKSFL